MFQIKVKWEKGKGSLQEFYMKIYKSSSKGPCTLPSVAPFKDGCSRILYENLQKFVQGSLDAPFGRSVQGWVFNNSIWNFTKVCPRVFVRSLRSLRSRMGVQEFYMKIYKSLSKGPWTLPSVAPFKDGCSRILYENLQKFVQGILYIFFSCFLLREGASGETVGFLEMV